MVGRRLFVCLERWVQPRPNNAQEEYHDGFRVLRRIYRLGLSSCFNFRERWTPFSRRPPNQIGYSRPEGTPYCCAPNLFDANGSEQIRSIKTYDVSVSC
jgi:hypothetical protein